MLHRLLLKIMGFFYILRIEQSHKFSAPTEPRCVTLISRIFQGIFHATQSVAPLAYCPHPTKRIHH